MKKNQLIQMKQIVFIVIVFFQSALHSQNTIDTFSWCPKGASWTYSMVTQTYYVHIQFNYVKDTFINQAICKKIDAYQYTGNLTLNDMGKRYLKSEFYKLSNDSVYLFYQGNFLFLYSFNVKQGDTLIYDNQISRCLSGPNNIRYDTAIVGAIYNDTFGGIIYPAFQCKGAKLDYSKISKNIGATTTPFPQIKSNLCNGLEVNKTTLEYGFFAQLICYRDDMRGDVLIDKHASSICAYFSSISSQQEEIPIVNVDNNMLYINGMYKQAFILNELGQIKRFILSNTKSIDISGLPEGLYFLKVLNFNHEFFVKKIIK